jgi:WD40 repeat protein
MAKVDAFVAELARLGVTYWMDRNDIPVSVAWYDEVQAAIQETDFFVVCGSTDYAQSKQCQLEFTAADDLGKQIISRDILNEDPITAARDVAATVGSCTPDVRTHTELVVRSAAWERAARDKGLLISGGPLQKARRLSRLRWVKLPPVAFDFLAASGRKQRRFRRWTAVGITVVTLGALVVVLSGLAQSSIKKTTEENLNKFVALNREPDQDIYRELGIAAEQARTQHFSYLSRLPLVNALGVTVPERSYVVQGAPVTGFAADLIGTGEPPVTRTPPAQPVAPRLPATPSGDITDVARSQNGALVAASFANDGVIRIFTAPALTTAATIVVPATSSRLAFSGNNRFLATSVGPDVWIHDVRTGLRLGKLRGSLGAVRDLAWSADGDMVWAVADGNRVSAWRWRSSRVLIDNPALWFVSVAGPADNGEFVATTRDGHIFRTNTTTTTDVQTSARDAVSAALSPDGSEVAIGTQDSIVLHGPAGERTIALENCVPTGLSFAPDGGLVYIACAGVSDVRAYDPRSGALVRSAKLVNTSASSITTDAQGTVFVGSGFGEIIRLPADLSAQQVVLRTACGVPVRAVKSNEDGTVIAQTGDGAGTVRCMASVRLKNEVWETMSQVIAVDAAQQGRAVGLSTDGSLAATGYSDGTITFWTSDAEMSSEIPRDFGGEVRGIAFTPDKTNILVASRDGVLEVMSACALCRSTTELIVMAEQRVASARQMGLA